MKSFEEYPHDPERGHDIVNFEINDFIDFVSRIVYTKRKEDLDAVLI
jgi:hypothetical protein